MGHLTCRQNDVSGSRRAPSASCLSPVAGEERRDEVRGVRMTGDTWQLKLPRGLF